MKYKERVLLKMHNNRKHFNLLQKELRHRKGISKKYRGEYLERTSTKEYEKEYRIKNKEKIRLHRKRYKYLKKMGGELTINTIQQIYEENIKTYNTLTCYLCLKPIEFGKDNLEHKIPLSRGGTNARENLAIACQKCNCKKHDKTVEEFISERNLCHMAQ